MYFLRSNKSSDVRDSDGCEIDVVDLLNNDVIKTVFSDIVKSAISELNEKVTKLQEEVTNLRESNVELIHLLTNGESFDKQNNKNVTNNKAPVNSWAAVNSKEHSDKITSNKKVKNDKNNIDLQKQNNTHIEKSEDKNVTKSWIKLKDNGPENEKSTSNKNSLNYQKKVNPPKKQNAVFGTGNKSKSNLTAVSRISWLYVGRVTPGTGLQGMKQHIDVTFPQNSCVIELLPKWKNSKTEAFKIGFDYDLLDEAYNADNWPKNALIKKYTFFRE